MNISFEKVYVTKRISQKINKTTLILINLILFNFQNLLLIAVLNEITPWLICFKNPKTTQKLVNEQPLCFKYSEPNRIAVSNTAKCSTTGPT